MQLANAPDELGEGEVATWAPSSSTLISGPTEGILIDALLTFENAEQIAAWAKNFGKRITGVYITTMSVTWPSAWSSCTGRSSHRRPTSRTRTSTRSCHTTR